MLTPTASARLHHRKAHRLSIHGSIYFTSQEGDGTGTLCDVSRGGGRVISTIHVHPGESVTLVATLPDGKEAVLVDQAQVCWTHGHEFGLAIRKIAPPDAQRLQSFIRAHNGTGH
jgi:hypothetical protein